MPPDPGGVCIGLTKEIINLPLGCLQGGCSQPYRAIRKTQLPSRVNLRSIPAIYCPPSENLGTYGSKYRGVVTPPFHLENFHPWWLAVALTRLAERPAGSKQLRVMLLAATMISCGKTNNVYTLFKKSYYTERSLSVISK